MNRAQPAGGFQAKRDRRSGLQECSTEHDCVFVLNRKTAKGLLQPVEIRVHNCLCLPQQQDQR